jgi:hypothetical protein
VALEDGPAKFDEIERIGGTDSHDWFRVVVKEGRNREVRRLWESQGCQVSRLKRTRYGKVSLPRELARGHSVELGTAQVEALRAQLKLEEAAPSAHDPAAGDRPAPRRQDHRARARRWPWQRLRQRPQHRRRGASCVASTTSAKTAAVAAAARRRFQGWPDGQR